ncbi:MAG: SPOR domain-containing protein [Bacteroidota bacterium]
MNIDHHISELLYQYDCVIIPGFGGLVANYSPAKIHPTQHTFSPPSKNISFNKNLNNNDGLLANYIAGKENITYTEANKIIFSFTETCNDNLNRGEKVGIKNIGTFYYDVEQNIQFEPDRSVNYLTDSFGLTIFQSPPIKRETIEKKIEKRFIDRPPVSSERRRARLKKYWPALVAIPILFLIFWIPLKTNLLDDLSINYSAFNPFAGSRETLYLPRSEEERIIPDLPDEKDPLESWLASATAPKEPVEAAPKFSEEKKYHIIGGCFQYLGNAKRLMKKLKKRGFDAQIIGQNKRGLYRVSYGGFTTRKEAKKVLAKVRAKYIKSAWLFVK